MAQRLLRQACHLENDAEPVLFGWGAMVGTLRNTRVVEDLERQDRIGHGLDPYIEAVRTDGAKQWAGQDRTERVFHHRRAEYMLRGKEGPMALALTWGGAVDTGIAFNEFFDDNFTIAVRFLRQYPNG